MSNIHIQIEVSGLEQSSKILYSEALNRKRTDNILTKKNGQKDKQRSRKYYTEN